ncbi:MAG: tetratricopeptide repeat protein [Terriglobia bacterium]
MSLALLCVARGSAWPQQNPQTEAAWHANLAAAAMQRHDFAQAEKEWAKVVELDHASAQAQHNLGIVRYLQRKYPAAEQALRHALKLDPALGSARALLGASLVREGKADQAIAELDRALKSRLNDSAERTARLALHEALMARGDYGRAVEVLQPLARRDPKDLDALYYLGQVYLQLSAEKFREIAQADPDSCRVHQIVADSLAKQGLYKDAMREYRAALDKKPDLPGVHYQIGLLYWLHEQTPEGISAAKREYEQEIQINPFDAWTEFRLGQVNSKQHDEPQAIAHLRRAIEIDPTHVPARTLLARVLESGGALAEAQAQLEAARKIDPNDPTVRYRLAQLYKRRGDEATSAVEMKAFKEIQASREGSSRELEKALKGIAEPEGQDEEH